MTPLDELGMAITNAGYTWTPEMRKAYEEGVRQEKREWVGLTDEEIEECKINIGLPHAINWRISVKVMQAKLKEKNT
jgi:hypothetical protein